MGDTTKLAKATDHLEEALNEAESEDVKRHIREALQRIHFVNDEYH